MDVDGSAIDDEFEGRGGEEAAIWVGDYLQC